MRIAVLTQYKSHSLDRHVTTTWRLSPLLGNYVTPVPAQMRRGPHWFAGSADAIFQSLNLVYDERPEYVIVFGADHVYRMDPRQMVEQHIAAGRRGDGGRDPGADRRRQPVRGHRDRRRRAPHQRLPGEAERPPGPARRARPGVRVHGQLRVPRRHPDRGRVPGRQGRGLQARPGRQHHPHDGGAGRGRGLRLRRQRGARGHRPGPRLLAGRRHPRRLLRGPHGPDLGPPGVQPLQPQVADPELARAAAAGQVRVRGRRRADRARARLDGLGRGGGVGRARCGARSCRRGCGSTPAPWSRGRC